MLHHSGIEPNTVQHCIVLFSARGLIIKLHCIIFCVFLFPLAPFFPQGLHFIVNRIFQECNPNKQQEFAVYEANTYGRF
jgi:hypothetical protein